MQSPLSQAGPVEPFQVKTDVQHLEKLLNRIFGDEIEKALEAGESNLIEFPQSPFIGERAENLPTAIEKAPLDESTSESTINFSPSAVELFSLDSEPLKSIIEEDDAMQESRLHHVVSLQRKEMEALRRDLQSRDTDIKLYKLELAANADQLKYLPELFAKALQVGELNQTIKDLQSSLDAEQASHEQSRDLLHKTQARVDKIKGSFWYRLGSFLGLELS
jgi:hypothetical protein